MHAIEAVSLTELRKHISKLADDIGPRPTIDINATEKTIAYITMQLTGAGYTIATEHYASTLHIASSGYVEALKFQTLEPNAPLTEVDLHPYTETRSGTPCQIPLPSGKILSAQLQGLSAPKQVIEIVAHYDTVRYSPGADDNGSGVAALLELARCMRSLQPERSIRFVFVPQEEMLDSDADGPHLWPGTLGSSAHVHSVLERATEVVCSAIVLESIGVASDLPHSQRTPGILALPATLGALSTTGNFLGVFGNTRRIANALQGAINDPANNPDGPRLKLINGFIGEQLKSCAYIIPDTWRSDHGPYWAAGIAAAMLTDTANFRNKHYHQTTDTPETINYSFLQQVTRAVLLAASNLAMHTRETPHPGFFARHVLPSLRRRWRHRVFR